MNNIMKRIAEVGLVHMYRLHSRHHDHAAAVVQHFVFVLLLSTA